MTTTEPGREPTRLGEHRWLLPYRTRQEPARLTAWAEAQLEAGVIAAEDRHRLVAELHKWDGTTERVVPTRPRHSA